ncbi:ribonuclease [Burkholderia sp. SG-MS1]|uniref:YihY/virulence factor BrkB family protein n=1 Tax=Paraburkholderia sp. SG-MS1 TaxID=2023741 RepID=UPI001447CB8B|nr:YihY/virulence factor BrkB family protein [Paraburkholderia sp. SG-MS1]NKJ50839.1 ribonuclease [Paraburkholderia sp. SG-MS1]
MSSQANRRAVALKPSLVSIGRAALSKFSEDRCPMMGASIGFFSAFSLAPTLLIVLAVAGWFFGQDAAKGRLFDQIKGVLGNDAASAMQSLVEHAHTSSGSGVAAALSIALLAIGASATFSSLNTALDVVFHAESAKGIAGLALLLRARLVSFGMAMGLGFLLVVSLVLDAAIQFAGHAIFGDSALIVVAFVGESVLGLVVLAIGFAALIKWLPDVNVHFRHALVGGVTASALFTAGRHLFGFYLAHAGTASSFGAAGSLAVLMMWLFFAAVVFLFGSEVTAALREASKTASDKPSERQQSPDRTT